jgi:hypothetical protein
MDMDMYTEWTWAWTWLWNKYAHANVHVCARIHVMPLFMLTCDFFFIFMSTNNFPNMDMDIVLDMYTDTVTDIDIDTNVDTDMITDHRWLIRCSLLRRWLILHSLGVSRASIDTQIGYTNLQYNLPWLWPL